ncbi:MAG: hypothetical protein K2N27_05085 [Ruminococcus sp.]|nr:hypothetical protein [Ruminococcus sp.]
MWNEINTDEDIAYLMDTYGGFHETCIVSLNYISGNYMKKGKNGNMAMATNENINHCIMLTVDSEWRGRIELMFNGVKKFSCQCFEDCYMNYILLAYLKFHDNLRGKADDRLIVWANDEDFDLLSLKGSYIIADSLKWRYSEYD